MLYTIGDPEESSCKKSRLVHGGPNAKDAEKCVQPGLFYRNMKPTSQVGLFIMVIMVVFLRIYHPNQEISG